MTDETGVNTIVVTCNKCGGSSVVTHNAAAVIGLLKRCYFVSAPSTIARRSLRMPRSQRS